MSYDMKPNGTYYVRYRLYGVQVQKSFGKGEDGKAAAKAYDDLIKSKKSKKKNSAKSQSLAPASVEYIDELAIAFYKANANGEMEKWVSDWKKMLNRHILEPLGQIPLKELAQEHIVELLAEKFPNAKPVTHGRYITYLSSMFNYGVEQGYMPKNPLGSFKQPKPEQKPFSLTLDTILRLRDVSPPHLAFAIEIMVNTGVRPGESELLSLQWQHVMWNKSEIRVFATKTHKWRTIPLKPEFMEKLRMQRDLAQTDYIVEYKGKKVKSVHKAFRTACNKIGESKSTVLYDIRHWYCSTLLSAGVPVLTVSKLMGHSSPMMTLTKYAHVISGDIEKSLAHIPDIA